MIDQSHANIEHKAALAEEDKRIGVQLAKFKKVGDVKDAYADELKGKNGAIRIKADITPGMPKKITWDDIRKHGYFMNIWDVEPMLLDALALAKEENMQNKKLLYRSFIRAASWTTHKPVNPEVAERDAQDFLSEARERERQTKQNPFSKQTGFGFDEETDAKKWQQVIEEVGTMDCKGDRVEAATEFVEKIFVKEWKEFLSLYHEKGKKRTWPDRGIDVKLEPEVKAATERIIKLRGIRDQLYFQRLFPKLCEFGHEGIKKRSI
jgi:hypothetical protein